MEPGGDQKPSAVILYVLRAILYYYSFEWYLVYSNPPTQASLPVHLKIFQIYFISFYYFYSVWPQRFLIQNPQGCSVTQKHVGYIDVEIMIADIIIISGVTVVGKGLNFMHAWNQGCDKKLTRRALELSSRLVGCPIHIQYVEC